MDLQERQEKALIEYDGLIKDLAKYHPIHGYDKEDIEQEFRLVLLKAVENFDPTKGIQFTTYFITSCKNVVKKIKKREYADKRPRVDLLLDKTDPRTGVKFIKYFADVDEDKGDKVLASIVIEKLEELETGGLTLDRYLGGLTYEELAEKYELSLSKAYRVDKSNIEEVKARMKE